MEMRWVVIVKEHLDDDTKEAADFRYRRTRNVVQEKCLLVSFLLL